MFSKKLLRGDVTETMTVLITGILHATLKKIRNNNSFVNNILAMKKTVHQERVHQEKTLCVKTILHVFLQIG